MCCPELPVTFWTANSEDVQYCTELLVTFWTDRSEDVLHRALSHFLDSHA
jgi:hypothetical protein